MIAVVLKHNVAIDTILMHRSMPKMSEIATTRAIRRMERKGRLKKRSQRVAVTAIMGAEVQKECLDAGMDGFCPSRWGWGGGRAFWGYGLAWAMKKAVRMLGSIRENGGWSVSRVWTAFGGFSYRLTLG